MTGQVPEHRYIHKSAVFSPDNFLQQVFDDMGSAMKIAPSA